MRRRIILLSLLFSCGLLLKLQAQDYVHRTFGSGRVISGHALDSQEGGEIGFVFSHRFGNIRGDAEQSDRNQMYVRTGIEYGLTDWLGIGLGRSSLEKTWDTFIKLRFIRQKTASGSPFSMTYIGGVALRTIEDTDSIRSQYGTNNLYFSHQYLIGSKISDRFSIQFMPTLLHRNFTASKLEKNDVFALGFALRYRMTRALAVSAEHYRMIGDPLGAGFQNPLSLALDWESSGQLIQLQISNSAGMTERFLLGETRGDQLFDKLFLGVNIIRNFKLRRAWR